MKPRTVGFVLSVLSAVAIADPHSKGVADTLQTNVAIGDLNLNSVSGIGQVRARIHAAALHLCNQFRNASHIDDREIAADCVCDAQKRALESLRIAIQCRA